MAAPALTRTLSGPTVSGTRFPSVSKVFTGNRDDSLVQTIAAGATAVEYDLAFPYAQLQLLVLQARGGVLTIHTNAADGTGGDTIVLVDGRPTLFEVGGPFVNPLTANVTKMYFTNATAVAIDVEVIALNQV